jgi:hypothetical protein
MKRALQIVAAVLLLAGLGTWLGRGANRGWTKTSVEVRTVDEITGIEGITNEKRFVPGVDFLGAALLAAGALTGVSFFIRKSVPETKSV